MRIIVSGSRNIDDYNILVDAINAIIEDNKLEIDEIIHKNGKGIDQLADRYAKENGIPVVIFKPDWKNIDVADAQVEINKWGKQYNKNAAKDAERVAAEYADAAIVIDNKWKEKDFLDMDLDVYTYEIPDEDMYTHEF